MTITIRVTELELDLLKKKKEQTGKNTTEILKSAIYFTGVDETFVDNLISTIGAHASNNDIEGIKEEVQKYVASHCKEMVSRPLQLGFGMKGNCYESDVQ